MAYTIPAYIVMAYVVVAYVVMACIGTAFDSYGLLSHGICTYMAELVMASVVMGYPVTCQRTCIIREAYMYRAWQRWEGPWPKLRRTPQRGSVQYAQPRARTQ